MQMLFFHVNLDLNFWTREKMRATNFRNLTNADYSILFLVLWIFSQLVRLSFFCVLVILRDASSLQVDENHFLSDEIYDHTLFQFPLITTTHH